MTSANLPASNVKSATSRALERYSTLANDVVSSPQELDAELRMTNLECLAKAAYDAALPECGFLTISAEDFGLIRDFYLP